MLIRIVFPASVKAHGQSGHGFTSCGDEWKIGGFRTRYMKRTGQTRCYPISHSPAPIGLHPCSAAPILPGPRLKKNRTYPRDLPCTEGIDGLLTWKRFFQNRVSSILALFRAGQVRRESGQGIPNAAGTPRLTFVLARAHADQRTCSLIPPHR